MSYNKHMEKSITLTHVNIRQSISILIGKIFVIDLIAAVIVLIFYFVLSQSPQVTDIPLANMYIFLIVFVVIGLIKLCFDGFVILSWLNEYYEITPEYIYHKSGIIFKKTEQYRVDLVRAMDVNDSFIGQLFNFATITLYDIRLKKYMDLYMIHNAKRYAKIFKQLRPKVETKKDEIRTSFSSTDEDMDELEMGEDDLEDKA